MISITSCKLERNLLNTSNKSLIILKCQITLACTDTASWNDGYGMSCNHYRTSCTDYPTYYCCDGKAGSLSGVFYNFPEKNCCGCGKGEIPKPINIFIDVFITNFQMLSINI